MTDEDNWQLLLNTSEKYNILLSDKQLEQFITYWHFLNDYNQHTNIVSSSEQKTVIVKHFIDSLSLNLLKEYLNFNAELKVIDIGSGGGFPGIPLIIANPDWQLCAVDSVGKKTKFIELLVKELGVEKRVEIITARAEDIGHNEKYREKFDIAVSRAVSQLSILSEYCIPFVKTDGLFVAYKAKEVQEELNQASKAILSLGGKLKEVASYFLPEDEPLERSLVIVNKIRHTPAIYPRKAGIPKKNPII
ncbi:MAG: 16S rRNA (guanine(527)-N(7))-methyltransferase RsmG [Candidatus Gastranaerophilales bacterium]|nr:16S rRNA (guanine(527)-N(7))-methyltransferase RsmG [Candidatus Gastranaerophilales bacterium]